MRWGWCGFPFSQVEGENEDINQPVTNNAKVSDFQNLQSMLAGLSLNSRAIAAQFLRGHLLTTSAEFFLSLSCLRTSSQVITAEKR